MQFGAEHLLWSACVYQDSVRVNISMSGKAYWFFGANENIPVASSLTVIIENCILLPGTWQGVYLYEFDPPQNRKLYVKVLEG